jgi:hypothetical protein
MDTCYRANVGVPDFTPRLVSRKVEVKDLLSWKKLEQSPFAGFVDITGRFVGGVVRHL